MKKTIMALCLAASALCLHARAIQEELDLTEEKAKKSYAFGMMIGMEILPDGLDLDYAALARGLEALMKQGNTLMSKEEAAEIVEATLDALTVKEAEANKAKEAAFLAENGERAEVHTTPSGLQYEILTDGSGEKPGQDDTVQVHYEGRLIDGTVFDSSLDRDEPEMIPLDRVIPGWAEGIQLMGIGSKYRLYIPSRLAYGERGAGQVIPPYSTLVFTVELLDIIKPQD
jgi:FKBP-type peptidyl-prolyl cis-trans isomerase